MKTQHYKIKATPEHLANAKPGQMVFESNESNTVIGFIDFISDCEIAFMLFDPIEKQDFMINIQSECNYKPRLKEILGYDTKIAQKWAELI